MIAVMAFSKHDPARPVRIRLFSPLGFYPKQSIAIPGARLLVRDDLIASAVQVEAPDTYGFDDEHFSDLEFLALEETRFLAGIVLAVHPDNGMAYTYPLDGHVDVAFGLDEDALLGAAREYASNTLERGRRSSGLVLPPACGGPAYDWREPGVNVARVSELVLATRLDDHLLMRGLGALLRADMCWQHREIAEAAVIQLYVALEVSFQLVLQILRQQGVPNPSAIEAGALVGEVFNPGIDTGGYFAEYYESRVKTVHPSSRFGVFPVAPLEADDYFHLRHGLVEVYHWLITKQKVQPE